VATQLPAGGETAERGRGLDPGLTNDVVEAGGLGAKVETGTADEEDLGRLGTGKRARGTARRSASVRRRVCRPSRGIA